MPSEHHKKNQESKSKSCNCKKQFKRIRKQLERIENAIESTCGQLPTETLCECRAEFAGVKMKQNEQIEGIICNNCRFDIGLGYTTPNLFFQGLLLESVTCSFNNTMKAIGIGKLSGKFVDFELFLTKNPNTIKLRVFKCQEIFIDTTFTGAEVAPIFSITRCP